MTRITLFDNRYLMGKKVEFFTRGEVGKPLSGVADYALDAEAGLRYNVIDLGVAEPEGRERYHQRKR
jgi:hypothetical protein